MSDAPGSESIPHAWLLDRFDKLEERLLTHSRAVRIDMNAGFDRIAGTIHQVDDRARLVTDRVTVIETERRIEEKAALKHGAVAGVVVSSMTMGVIEAIKRVWR